MKIHAITLGCKLNQAETLQKTIQSRSELVPLEEAEEVLIHTCAVTKEAERKSKKAIRRAVRAGKRVKVTGCLATLQRKALLKLGADVVLGNEKNNRDAEALSEETPLPRRPRVFLKIQDGCLRHCAFCIVPSSRPILYSRPQKEILRDAERWIQGGTQEIVLTGASIGLYGLPKEHPRRALPELLYKLVEKNVPRIRLTSFDPRDFNQELLSCFRLPALCPHLHLSLQSGDDEILKKMGRGYTSAQFLQLCDLLRNQDPRFSITTDVLVGFPGETAAAFENTLTVMQKARFSRIHVFPFSPRPGTQGALLKETVAPKEKKKRVAAARDLARHLEKEYAALFLGRPQEILLENTGGVHPGGYTRYYLYAMLKEGGEWGERCTVVPHTYTSPLPNFATGGFYASLCTH